MTAIKALIRLHCSLLNIVGVTVLQDLQFAWFRIDLSVAHTRVALDYNNPFNECEKAGVYCTKVKTPSSVYLLHIAFLY